jgi:hypothetical protein
MSYTAYYFLMLLKGKMTPQRCGCKKVHTFIALTLYLHECQVHILTAIFTGYIFSIPIGYEGERVT